MIAVRSTIVNIHRALCSNAFVCCIAAVALMLFSNTIGYDPDTLDPLTIFSVLMRSEIINQDVHYCSFQVFTASSPMWLIMFTPVLSAFAYVPIFCDERQSQLSRLLIARQGKLRYAVSHVGGTMLTGGLTMFCGFALFGLAVSVLFPSLHNFNAASVSEFLEEQAWCYPKYLAERIREGHLVPAILLKCAEMFLYGAVSALPALVCAAFTRNKYTVLCLPFFAAYSWTQLNTRLSAKNIISDSEHPRFTQFLNISSANALLVSLERDTAQVLLLHGSFSLLLILIYLFIMQRRWDCGT